MKISILLTLILALVGCSPSEPIGMSSGGARMVAERSVTEAEVAPGSKGPAQATRRYLALKHKVTLMVPAASLAQHFGAIQAECIKLGCEILSAGQETENPEQLANATLSARVPPAAFSGFFTGIQAHGKLLSHYSESEDKTAEVIDVEARIKNLEALKARVLELLAKNAGSLKDMLDAEKHLAETQAALDSINGKRRVLASQTDMISIEIELRPQSLRTEGRWTAPVAEAADEAGEVLMKSLAFLLTATVALLPWALLTSLVIWAVRPLWRRRRAAKLAKVQLDR
ncbi:MAG: DUF4349 domain-containing protein [Telluria sp.]